jgi:hypothetical protein
MPSNGRPIVMRFASAGMCLPNRCLAMGLNVTILKIATSWHVMACSSIEEYPIFRGISCFHIQDRSEASLLP